jgi:hypothetical protein
MDHTLKENWIAHIRSGRYRVCQYHLAKEGFGKIREYTPWGILVELAEVEHEWRECEITLMTPHRSHKAMYITEGTLDNAEELLGFYGLERGQEDQLRFRAFPDEVLDRLGIGRDEFEELREMADGGYDGTQRIYAATFNQMADWAHRHIEADEPDNPENEIGPSQEWQDQQNSDTGGSLNARRSRRTLSSQDISDKEIKHYSALPGEPVEDEAEPQSTSQ